MWWLTIINMKEERWVFNAGLCGERCSRSTFEVSGAVDRLYPGEGGEFSGSK